MHHPQSTLFPYTTLFRSTVFGDPLGRIVADPRHSSGEARFVLLGLSEDRRLLAVMYLDRADAVRIDRKSTRLNSSHLGISYAVFCSKKKKTSSALASHYA